MKKQLLALVFAILFLSLAAAALDGSGSSADPYVLYDADDFLSMASLVNAGTDGYDTAHYALWADVDFTGVSYVMPGTAAHPFRGVFDGNGYALKNITVTSIGAGYQSSAALAAGTFAFAENALITDLAVEDMTVGVAASNIPVPFAVGLVVGRLSQTDASVETGLVRCSSTGSLATVFNGADVYAGGLAGFVTTTAKGGNITLEDSYSHASVSVSGSKNLFGGGLVGRIEAKAADALFSVKNVYSDGVVRASDGRGALVCLGGIAGMAVVDNEYGAWAASLSAAATVIENAYFAGTVSGTGLWPYLGSIVGYVNEAAAENTYAAVDSYICSAPKYGIGGTKTAASGKVFLQTEVGFDFGSVWTMKDGKAALRYAHAPKVAEKGGKLLVSVGDTACGTAVTAFYAADGRTLAVKAFDAPDGTTAAEMPQNAASYKVFFLEDLITVSPVSDSLAGTLS